MIPTNNFWSLSLSLWRFYLKIKQYSRIINFILQIELLAVTTWPWPPLLFVCLSCGLVSAPLLNLLAHFSTKRPKFGGAHKGQPKGQAELSAPNPINATQSRSAFWLPFQSDLLRKRKLRKLFLPSQHWDWVMASQVVESHRIQDFWLGRAIVLAASYTRKVRI